VTRFTIVVLPDAEAELHEAFLWYFDKSPLAADAFGTEVDGAIDGLEETAADWQRTRMAFTSTTSNIFPTLCATKSTEVK
jgi:plasmid stabilization system protein ParE